jgi:farnesyl diphosphate synthase
MSATSLSLKAALSQVGADVDRRLDKFLAIPDDPRADLYRAMRHAALTPDRAR